MIRNYAIKTALLLTMVSPAPATLRAQAGGSEDAAAAIRSLEQQWTVGQSRNNNAALDLIFDNALVYVEYGKLVPKGEYLARIKHEEPAATQIEIAAHVSPHFWAYCRSHRHLCRERGRPPPRAQTLALH